MQKNIDLVYEFAPLLIGEAPKDLITVLISYGAKLDATKLIPALLQENFKGKKDTKSLSDEVVRYLEYCLHKLRIQDKVIHNYLLALYAQFNQPKLQTYIEAKGEDESLLNYDIKYVLRICTELNFTSACIHLYATMGLYEEAIDLAISHDLFLAKRIADAPQADVDLKRKLWLKIAKHVVLEEKDIRQVTEFLKECDLLKIEDILPYFPDFVTIDHFKDAICSSLEEYNKHIESLKEEMKEATENVEDIREEIKELRQKNAIVRTDNGCALCTYPVVSRSFYVFPCLHSFHSDCLLTEVRPHLNDKQRKRIDEIEQFFISGAKVQAVTPSPEEAGNSSLSKERLAAELDDIIAAECFFCGELMIRSVDQPFISPDESHLVSSGWD